MTTYQPSLLEAQIMPAHNSTPTSVAAAAQAIELVSPQQRIVLEYLAKCGERGATQDETLVATGMNPNSIHPRFNELADHRSHLIEPINETRMTRWKRRAVVYVITDAGRAKLADAGAEGYPASGGGASPTPVVGQQNGRLTDMGTGAGSSTEVD